MWHQIEDTKREDYQRDNDQILQSAHSTGSEFGQQDLRTSGRYKH